MLNKRLHMNLENVTYFNQGCYSCRINRGTCDPNYFYFPRKMPPGSTSVLHPRQGPRAPEGYLSKKMKRIWRTNPTVASNDLISICFGC